jgi:choline dehydrogenase-like flavoprotein
MAPSNRKIYDALVVGSGASGGWVAKELTERGMEVLMLEAGPPRIPTRDFTEHVWPYQLKFRGFRDQGKMLTDQPVQSLCYACDEYTHQFFVKDSEHPYTFPAGKPFMWIRCRQVGGRTYCWARESYRYTDYSSRQPATMDMARTGRSAMRSSSRTTTRWRASSA